MGQEAAAVIAAAGIAVEETGVSYELDMHYLGQTHTLAVPLPAATDVSEAAIRQAFEKAYLASFSRLLPGLAMRIVSLRVTAIGRRPPFDFSAFRPGASASLEKARLGARRVWFDGGWRDTAIFARLESAGRRDHRGAGDPGAARRHHRDRAWACAGASTRWAISFWSGRDESQNQRSDPRRPAERFPASRRRLRPRRAGRSVDRGVAGKARAAGRRPRAATAC